MSNARHPLAVEMIEPFLHEYPVDIRGMAKALGLKVVEDSLASNISGKLHKDWWGDYVVTVNSSHSETRKRFTIAHEIAHYVLHRDLIEDGIVDNALYRDDRIGDWLERQANRYAATLLMPMTMVRDAWDRGQQTAAALSRSFKVSEAVAQIRMIELGCDRWREVLDEIPF